MKYYVFGLVLCLLSCKSQKDAVNYTGSHEEILTRILEEEVQSTDATVTGVSLTVISPQLGIDFSGASGYDSMTKNHVLTPDQPFRIASLTKTFVATSILRLREKGLVSIDDPITNYISKEHIAILEKGGYTPSHITIKQCMTHTSGLFDYAEGNMDYITEAAKDPYKRWTRTEQIQWAMDHGEPKGAPGENYHYSDTGYVLLGEIIEKQTNKGLAEGIRELLKFDTLGMTSTWLESLEDRPDGLPTSVRRYMETLDASDWDNSVDLYGGGGLQSTTRDLAVFLQALFSGKVYEKQETLPVMLLKSEFSGDPLTEYRLGFGYIKGKKSDIEAYMHSGFWGTLFIHFPAYNCSIAINHTNDESNGALQKVINYIQWLAEQQ
ncbi:serine hydrolase [uncultured Dokdonia sp.]|uniref:serine hydrolase domain-containing protein n=1 Tax=uncultured Dokdonia sp. TaxID=575653 RepID=UPI0026210B5F|nr:serine hydrolase [uncultured Dokdonia sp.]